VARTPERLQVLKKQVAHGPQLWRRMPPDHAREAGDKYPVMRTDDLQGGIWLPGDGKANPADLCMSLAKGARNRGVKMHEGIEVTGVITEERPRGGRAHRAGRRALRGPGQLRRPVGAPVRQAGGRERAAVFGRALLHRHRQDPGVHPMMPVMRDPDGFIYYKEEVGGLVMGGFEPVAKPWKVDPIPGHLPV
jgi:glycine/D-amino acid oxidase-like deaminating enzyme